MRTETNTDPVVGIRNQVEATHAAMAAASSLAAETAVSDRLPSLWLQLNSTTPTSLLGAAILVREAEDYTGDLCAPDLAFSVIPAEGYFYRMADRIENGTHTAKDQEAIRFFARVGELALSADHTFPRLLANAVSYLASRSAH